MVCPKAQVEVQLPEVEFELDQKKKQFDKRQELDLANDFLLKYIYWVLLCSKCCIYVYIPDKYQS